MVRSGAAEASNVDYARCGMSLGVVGNGELSRISFDAKG